jgi:DNA-binding MarR family transcriptional regulator
MPNNYKMTRATANFFRVVNHLNTLDPEHNMTRMQVFYMVAKANADGALVRDITKTLGINQSSVQRQLGALADNPTRQQKVALRWIEIVPDPDDVRRVRLHLTPKGEQVLAQINDILE